jgi:hypothetical protein
MLLFISQLTSLTPILLIVPSKLAMYFSWASLAAALVSTGLAMPQLFDVSNSITALSGTGNTSDASMLGNYYNYWTLKNNKTTYDLTRSDRMRTTRPKTIPMLGSRQEAIIEPNRTAFIIIDMQNFFLHPQLSPRATKGRNAVQPTLNMIDAFRENDMKVLWVNWGLNDFDLVTIPPSFLEGFSSNSEMNTTFGSDMGTLTEENGTMVELGRKLWRGSWNAQPYGPLYPAMVEGLAKGTDLYFNKSMFSTTGGVLPSQST